MNAICERSKALVTALTVVAALIVATPAHAISVSYTVDGVGPTSYPAPTAPPANAPWGPDGYPGDTVTLQSYTGTLDLTPGSYIQQVNTLLWTIDYTYAGTATDPNQWSDLSFVINAGRGISIDGQAGALSQTGLLDLTWENDFLSFSAGPTLNMLVQSYNVAITLLGLPVAGGVFDGSNPWAQPDRIMNAQFDVSIAETPVPAALPLFASGAGLIGWFGWRRKRKGDAKRAT